MRGATHRILAAGAMVCALTAAQVARADFIYDLIATEAFDGFGDPTGPLDFRLTLSDAAVASDSFSASRNCSPGVPLCSSNTGNFSEISLAITNVSPSLGGVISATPDPFFDQTNVALTFGPGGVITSGSIFELNSQFELQPLTISGTQFNANFGADWLNCGIGPACTEQGVVHETQAIPEPASIGPLGTALLGLGLIRRRRRTPARSLIRTHTEGACPRAAV